MKQIQATVFWNPCNKWSKSSTGTEQNKCQDIAVSQLQILLFIVNNYLIIIIILILLIHCSNNYGLKNSVDIRYKV